ncbi:MAG: type II secretion system F family protein [Verrucomicrobiaceae bacterium]|nr:MAG: type II secretion system F family protein [Verrucomicrobiaceae bacterium]
MAKFEYIALNAKGEETAGTVDAGNRDDASAKLKGMGLFPTQVAPEGQLTAAVKQKSKIAKRRQASKGPKKAKGKIKGKNLMIFTRQLATLIDSGLPLLRGLTVLGNQEPNPVLRSTVNSLADSVQTGSTFSESLAQHPKIFNKLYVNMVKAGELGGVLELVLNRLAEYQEKAQKLKNKIVSAMTYPVIVVVIAMGIVVFLLTYIVPKFTDIFESMVSGGKDAMPALTKAVIGASDFVKGNLHIILGAGAGLWFGSKAYAATKGGRRTIDKLVLKLPLFGSVLLKSSVARFSRTLGTLVTSGVPILQALNITRDTAGNQTVSEAIMKIHDAVKEGESMVAPMTASKIFPAMVISMVEVGEETGQLPEMLLKIADVYDDEVDNSVTALTSLLEPIMIVVLAVIVAVIVLALFQPLITVITKFQA